jgi:uncharacterized membrane protein
MATADRLTGVSTEHHPGLRRNDAVGVGMYLLAAFLFALNGVIAKDALNTGFDPMHLTQLRNAGAMVVLVAFVAIRHRDRFRIRKSELLFLITYGVVAFTLVQFLYFLTISRLQVGIGTLLAFLAPVMVALWMRFARRTAVDNRVWAAIALTLVGLALVAQVWQGFSLDPLGVAAGLLCAVALAAYWLLGGMGGHRPLVDISLHRLDRHRSAAAAQRPRAAGLVADGVGRPARHRRPLPARPGVVAPHRRPARRDRGDDRATVGRAHRPGAPG